MRHFFSKVAVQTRLLILLLTVFGTLGVSQYAKELAVQPQGEQTGSMPIYRVTVVARTTKAVNYRHRSGATTIDFKGTELLPKARGEAKVESKQGYIEIEVEFDDLQPATQFGQEYLTYVMWAITPEGRPTNLGEILLDGTKSKLNVTTELQAFGLIVTAEPYFAVTRPSNLVVMENMLRKETMGKIEQVEAKYELLERGQYTQEVDKAKIESMNLDPKIPLELYEAQNAVRIARWSQADKYAADSFQKAEKLMEQAEAYQGRKAGKKSVVMTAREAAQTAEDARMIAVKRREEERQANERRAAQEREANAKAEAEQQARLRAQAETEQRTEAERRARAEAEQRLQAELRTHAEAEQRVEAERRAQAEAEKAAAVAKQQAAQAEADKARLATEEAERQREKAEKEKAELRTQLLEQLNRILETRDTPRGLVVNMSEVLFDSGKYTLRPVAREKLAKIAGIVLAYPGLKLEIEGHTDSVGSEGYNQLLSEKRASWVRDYLLQQGVPADSITTRGFGETKPMVSNDTAAGRQHNRRVELVLSGEVIGVKVGTQASAMPAR
ncbi:MAG: OmpA family protein [Acidobacteria bacterium]|nr:OmpA family protein [Acidobacteriota bacterium]